MRYHFGALLLLLVILGVQCKTLVKRQLNVDEGLDPALQQYTLADEDRDKREVASNSPKDIGFAVKNALVGFVFNKSKGSSHSVRSVYTTTRRSTTTEDVVIFEKNKPVSLEVPSQLFGSGFSLITKTSTAVGDYMINSAIRFQRLLEVFRPLIRGVFGAKVFVSELTTDKPIFSDGSAS